MPVSELHIARARPRISPTKRIVLGPFTAGLVTNAPVYMLDKNQLSECLNWYYYDLKTLRTRPGVVQHSNSAISGNPKIVTIRAVTLGGTDYILLVDENHKLYYLDANGDPQLITTLEGLTSIIQYKDKAVILDGGYIKYMDSISDVKIVYDDGTSAYQFDYYTSYDATATMALGNGTNVRIATKFTSKSWTSGYTIPPTTARFKLSKTGTGGSGSVDCVLRLVSDDSILASTTIVEDVTDLPASSTPGDYTATFTSSDITTEMSPSTAYYLSLEYSGGDGSNYVNVHTDDTVSSGVAYYYDTSWHSDTTQTPVCYLKPDIPPKASFGDVYNYRLFVAGDPDHTNRVWFCNLDVFDWSTADGGGYISPVDASSTTFNVGAVVALYGDLYILGTQETPYLVKLTGSSPADYTVSTMFRHPWTSNRIATSVENDIWFVSAHGVNSLAGVMEYGDIRILSISEQIMDRFGSIYSDQYASVAYLSTLGLFLFASPSTPRIIVGHPRLVTTNISTNTRQYKWTEFSITKYVLTDSSFAWQQSAGGTNEYYLTDADGEDPGIVVAPDFITRKTTTLTKGTVGSLTSGEWGYGNNEPAYWIKITRSGGNVGSYAADGVTSTVIRYFEVNPGEVYEFGGDIKTDGTCVGQLGIGVFDENKANPSWSLVSGSDTTWESKSKTYTIPSGKKYLDFFIGAYTNDGWAGFDNVFLRKSGSSENLIRNPGFQLSVNPDWWTRKDSSVSVEVTGGNNGLGYDTIYIRDDSDNPSNGDELRAIIVPHSMTVIDTDLYMGGSDGLVYKLDLSEYKDMSEWQPDLRIRTCYNIGSFNSINIVRFFPVIYAVMGGSFNTTIYTEERVVNSLYTWSNAMASKDGLTVGDLLMDVGEATFAIESSEKIRYWVDLNILCRSYMLEFSDFRLAGYPMFLQAVILDTRPMQI